MAAKLDIAPAQAQELLEKGTPTGEGGRVITFTGLLDARKAGSLEAEVKDYTTIDARLAGLGFENVEAARDGKLIKSVQRKPLRASDGTLQGGTWMVTVNFGKVELEKIAHNYEQGSGDTEII
jgi:hypothetical protein